jgi:hypothetical protein
MRPKHLSAFARDATLGALFTFSLVAACSSDTTSHAGLADGCLINTDCNTPLVCAFRKCHNACTSSRDCPDPHERCVASDRPFDVCQLASERDCSLNSQCPAGEVCGVDGQCRDQCASARDCIDPQQCVDKTCAEPTELTDAGTFAEQPDATLPGTPCTYNSDCKDPLICRIGTCLYECITARDCAVPFDCIAHRCAPAGSGDGSTDGIADTGKDTLGTPCVDDAICQDGVRCNGAERCLRGACVPPLRALCDDGDPCTLDTCTESSGACTHMTMSNIDQDGDHHAPTSAADGGTLCTTIPADDCDDTNADVYPGHAEKCDELDNNCNGIVDEGNLWSLAPGAVNLSAVADAGALYPYAIDNGAFESTALVKLADGTFDAVAAGDRTNGLLEAWNLSSSLSINRSLPLYQSPSVDCPSVPLKGLWAPSLATNGTQLFAGVTTMSNTSSSSCCGTTNASSNWLIGATFALATGDLSTSQPASAVMSSTTASGCVGWSYYPGERRPAAAWVSSKNAWAVTWVQSANTTTQNVWVGWVSTTGLVTMQKAATANPADAQLSGSFSTPGPLIAAGPNNVMVAWPSSAGVPRVVLLDPVSLTVVGGPTLVQGSANDVGSLVYTGSAYMLTAASPNTGATLYVSRLDPTSGNLIKQISLPVSNTTSVPPMPQLALVGRGVFLSFLRDTSLVFGWTPEDLSNDPSQPIPLSSADLGTSSSVASVAAIDTKTVMATWVDGNVHAGLLTCAP